MPQVRFTQNIQRHVACPDRHVGGRTVREALDAYFTEHDSARSYVLDERGELRTHMNIFVQGRPITDRAALSDPVAEDGTVDVMQALSGG
jgi:molybdopterin synthase sulfur carrier subunit